MVMALVGIQMHRGVSSASSAIAATVVVLGASVIAVSMTVVLMTISAAVVLAVAVSLILLRRHTSASFVSLLDEDEQIRRVLVLFLF